ncbi:MAG: histidinol dehydrogenase [Clostridiaceae bacterium]|nr:histidinol dehydrogenase [Clostridiaceae bacterium]
MNKLLRILRTDRNELQDMVRKLGLRGKMDLQAVISSVEEILAAVRTDGDQAVLDYTEKFDKVRLEARQIRVSEREIGAALDGLDVELLTIMRQAAENIRIFHEAQLPEDIRLETAGGGYTLLRHRPLEIAGIYVPGGSAPLPSSVLMNAIPAKAAGVRRLIMCTPPGPDGSIEPVILAAAAIAGVDEIYRIGGAQAVAAMAYGTQTVPPVDKICGPGNIYVNTAKRLVYGQCDIDMFAGPSEILVIADNSADPAYVAADLLSQAEHDPLASSLLLTTSSELADKVAEIIDISVSKMPRREIIEKSLSNYGAALIVPDLDTAVDFVNELAPEHLELCLEDPELWSEKIRNAGAIFLGNYSPEPLGDYFAGPNHVLPTSGTARFFSPLNTNDFIKKTSVINYSYDDLAACWQQVATFADAEQLPAHADAIRVRFGKNKYGG